MRLLTSFCRLCRLCSWLCGSRRCFFPLQVPRSSYCSAEGTSLALSTAWCTTNQCANAGLQDQFFLVWVLTRIIDQFTHLQKKWQQCYIVSFFCWQLVIGWIPRDLSIVNMVKLELDTSASCVCATCVSRVCLPQTLCHLSAVSHTGHLSLTNSLQEVPAAVLSMRDCVIPWEEPQLGSTMLVNCLCSW